MLLDPLIGCIYIYVIIKGSLTVGTCSHEYEKSCSLLSHNFNLDLKSATNSERNNAPHNSNREIIVARIGIS